METAKISLFLIVSELIVAIGVSHSNVVGWHEDLGISDQRGAIIYNNQTLDPQSLQQKSKILNWKAGLQFQLDMLDLFCYGTGQPASPSEDYACLQAAKTVYDNCYHHPGVDEECNNPDLQTYMIQHNISGTYDSNYTRIEPGNSSKPSVKESLQDLKEKCLEIAILDCGVLQR
jgi:hypothetical protein